MLQLDSATILPLAKTTLTRCHADNKTLATAESCTGGLLAATLTHLPGSSAVFMGSVVCYSNASKAILVGVSRELIERHGAVSKEVVESMASGIRQTLATDFAVAITGIAGPEGGSPMKPVGTVWIAVAYEGGVTAECFSLSGDRAAVRTSAVQNALECLLRIMH